MGLAISLANVKYLLLQGGLVATELAIESVSYIFQHVVETKSYLPREMYGTSKSASPRVYKQMI